MVTRSLVSYDFLAFLQVHCVQLNGHQIIGELRQKSHNLLFSILNWMVTRSLVSYDCPEFNSFNKLLIEWSPDHWWVTTKFILTIVICEIIEWSPDHWWVTTSYFRILDISSRLNGHQIIGELRHHHNNIERLHVDWMVTRSLVSYDTSSQSWMKYLNIEWSPDHWWVTTLRWVNRYLSLINWMVTRSLVSYDMVTETI